MAGKPKYPKAFYDDGLGDILEWIDDEILVHADIERKKKTNNIKNKDQNEHEPKQSGKRKELKQDLYGENDLDKLKTKKARIVVDLDDQGDEVIAKVDKKLEDKVRGLANRLAAKTMHFVTTEFQQIYSNHQRTAVDQALFEVIELSIINNASLAKRKIVAELMVLVSYLSHKVSHTTGSLIVHRLFAKFDNLYSNGSSDEDKKLENISLCLANLYIIGLISAHIIFEFSKRICSSEEFRPKSVELLLILLKNVGFQLRKDNPSLMRQLILTSQDQCKQLKHHNELDSRIQFMMEALDAIKNNNMTKVKNYGCDIDKDAIEQGLKGLIKRTRLPESLSDATYNDIVNSANFNLLDLQADEIEGKDKEKDNKDRLTKFVGTKTEEKICKALGLKKPAEKTILSALLRVTDDVEASNTLIGFGTNHCSDVMVVCLHVAIYEKTYNPFYYNVINSLCKYHRKYKMAAKFALQDKIRALSGMPQRRVDMLKRLCFELIKNDAVPVTVLKSVEWSSLDESTKEFLTYLLTSISQLPDEERTRIMIKSDKRSTFAGAMRTFASCFLEDIELFK